MKHLLFFGLIGMGAPLAAQPAADAVPGPAIAAVDQPAAEEPIDPVRLATAKRAIDYVWPLGTYARMMDGTMDRMMDSMMTAIFDMPIGNGEGGLPDEVPGGDDDEAAGPTIRDTALAQDPHFEERMRITNRVMMDEMVPIMTRLEPQIREGLAKAYARKFTTVQLEDLNRFFATPSGGSYAREAMMLWVDPELMTTLGSFAPEMMKEMPSIMEKVQSATAHLPMPPKEEDEDESEERQPKRRR